jgi:hypothetical protein
MAQFMLLLHEDQKEWLKLSPEEMQKAIEKYIAWGEKIKSKGWYVGGSKLVDDAGKVMRAGNGKPRITDGPYSEAKEVLGGFYTIHADDYAQAVERASDHPHLLFGGTIEVRQVDLV